jgi:hypothetical protein
MYPIKIIVTNTSICLRAVLENYIIKDYFKIYNNEIDGHMTESPLPLHTPILSSRSSTAARLLRSWVRIPPGAWMFVCCECFLLSGRGLCDGQIIRSEESYRQWRVAVCDQVTSYARRLKPDRGL